MTSIDEAVKVVEQYTDGAITIEELINWIVLHFPNGAKLPDGIDIEGV